MAKPDIIFELFQPICTVDIEAVLHTIFYFNWCCVVFKILNFHNYFTTFHHSFHAICHMVKFSLKTQAASFHILDWRIWSVNAYCCLHYHLALVPFGYDPSVLVYLYIQIITSLDISNINGCIFDLHEFKNHSIIIKYPLENPWWYCGDCTGVHVSGLLYD